MPSYRPNEHSELRERLSKSLASEVAHSNFKSLSEEIQKANPRRRTVERRKLSALVTNDKSISLTMDELESIHFFLLGKHGVGLEAIFAESLIQAIVERQNRVALLLGTRPIQEERIIGVSRWDVRSLAHMTSLMCRNGPGINLDIHDVYKQASDGVGSLTQDAYTRAFSNTDWYRALFTDETFPSVISFGSERTAHSTEIMISKMLDVEPFDTSVDKANLPFQFFWPEDCGGLRSSFASEAIAEPGGPSGRSDVFGLKLYDDSEVHWVDRNQDHYTTYGVICAQWRSHGQMWIVLSGLTAAGTLAAAKEMEFIYETPQPRESGRNSKVLWAVVRAEVKQEGGPESRRLSKHELFRKPTLWPE